jgi:hypothetical protein
MSTLNRRFLFFGFILAALACSAALWADPPSRVGRLNLIDGSVSFRPASLEDWAPATLNYPLTTGDQLWTETGARAELHLGSTAVRLAAETDFSILLLDDRTVQLRLSQGTLDIRLRDLEPDEDFEIATPQASISLLQPGSYRIDVQEGGTTSIVVRSGEAELASGTSSVTVFPNQYVALTDSVEAFELRVAPAPDEWELWCMQRDQREDRLASSRSVPRTMVGYEDLDEYGSWQVIADYGTCWIPRRVPAGWAPYHFGRWVWVAPWGWTWIDDAPWGFAPFHYGRWAFVTGRWCWIPGAIIARPIYAPALVVFIGGTNWAPGVGWFPLGPREVYLPPYQVSNVYIHNVNIAYVTKIDIGRFDVRHHRYVNRSISGAVTVMSRQSFVRAEHAGRAAVRVRAADISGAPVIGTNPSLVPGRESIMARPAGAPRAAPRPPAASQDRPVVIRRAPPPAQHPERPAEAQQSGAQGRVRFKLISPPPAQGGVPERDRSAERRQVVPEQPRSRVISPPPAQGGVPERDRSAERRQVVPEQPRSRVISPPPAQGGVPEQDRSAERRQVVPDTRQGSEGPAFAPETPMRRKQPAGSGPKKKKIRKLVDGVWVWVEEEEGQ